MVKKTLNNIEIAHKSFDDYNINDLNATERQIIKFVHRWDRKISPNTGDISKNLNLPQSTISSSLKRMKDDATKKKLELIFEWEPYHGIALTSFGNEIAEHIEHHHHLLEIFLFKTLGLNEDECHKESDLLGVSVSCDLANKISEKFDISKDKLGQHCICPEEKGSECVLK